jgi:hypothetical protein
MSPRWSGGACLLAVAIASVQPAEAAPRLLHGVIVNELTGDPVEGASISSKHVTVTSGSDGSFTVALATDDTELLVAAPGYALRRVEIGSRAVVRIALTALHERIEITGEAPRPRRRGHRPSHLDEEDRPAAQAYHIMPEDLRVLPGTGNDALRAAQVLPGIARLPFSFGGVVLRGAAPRDSAVFLDGIEVPIAFHFGGVTAFYPSGMLDELEVRNSGIDAAYGRASGGMISLTSREPRTDRWHTGGAVGLLDSALFAEGPTHGGGVLVGIRRSYFDLVAAPFAGEHTPTPSYWDAQVRGSFGSPTLRGRIAPMMFLALDNMTRTSPGRDSFENEIDLTSFFIRFAAPYDRIWGPTTLRVVPWLGANRLSFRSRVNGVVQRFQRPVFPGGVRSELSRETGWGDVRGGLDLQGGHLTHLQSGLGHSGDILVQRNGETTIDWADLAAWAETRIDLQRLSVKPGLRVERYGLTGEGVIDPRLSLTLQLTDSLRLRETVGRYHQPPTPGDLDPNGGNPRLRSSYSDAASLGVDGSFDGGWSGSLTGYVASGHDLGVRLQDDMMDFKTFGGLGPTFSLLLEKQLGLAFYRENHGRARNYGVELLVRRQTERWRGLVAYTLSKALRHDGPSSSLGWRPFELDQRHKLDAAGSMSLGAWRVGARVNVVTGLPYSPTAGPSPAPERDLRAGRLPTYFRLDVRVDRLWHRCWGTIDLYFDIQNATNRRNVEGREPNELLTGDDDIRGLPIVPFIGVEFIPTS